MDTRLVDLVKGCQGFKVHEERHISYERIELIIYRKDMENWVASFTKELGPAIKPEGQKPDENHLKITESFGGINEFQTLFRKEFEDKEVLIMMWPWGDEEHVTLHMILQ